MYALDKMPKSGSYLPNDVHFLLTPIKMDFINTLYEKESLIQSGRKHYSEILTRESLPSQEYLKLFDLACDLNLNKMARHCLQLAYHFKDYNTSLVLISLARGGTPIGVIVNTLLNLIFNLDLPHYSISIIRDKGIDFSALRYILNSHKDSSLRFIDGWIGKGVIASELETSIMKFNKANHTNIDCGLHVLSDLAGCAKWSASCDDYLIPSSLLNTTISGLVSRSIYNPLSNQSKDKFEQTFHFCYYYKEFLSQDLSLIFKDLVVKKAIALHPSFNNLSENTQYEPIKANVYYHRMKFINNERLKQGLTSTHFIKPGIAEGTRVLLRRVPKLVLIKNLSSPEVKHIVMLAQEKNIPIEERPCMPYQAVSIIRDQS